MSGTIIMVDAYALKKTWPGHDELGKALLNAVVKGCATLLELKIIPLPSEKSRPGSPPGGTAWVGLDESHVTIHWYELEEWMKVAIDVFTCGSRSRPKIIINELLHSLQVFSGMMMEQPRMSGVSEPWKYHGWHPFGRLP